MWDFILLAGIIIGILFIVLSSKKKLPEYVKIAGIIMIVSCVVLSIPDFVYGFIHGFIDGFTGATNH